MIPFVVLVVGFCLFVAIGLTGNHYLADYRHALRPALAIMFLLTASAHWGGKRADLIRMVPAALARPDLLVTVTGLLEIAGAIGLLIPATAPIAAWCLALLLIAIFPANVHAARQKLTIGGRAVPQLKTRLCLQIVFIVCCVLAGTHS